MRMQRDLPSLHRETRKTAVGGRVLPPLAGISILSSNHLQTAGLALLRHQLNWWHGCLSLKIHSCPSHAAWCQGTQQLWHDPEIINKKPFPCSSSLSACLGAVFCPGKPKHSQLCDSTGKKICWHSSQCCTQASPRTLKMPYINGAAFTWLMT